MLRKEFRVEYDNGKVEYWNGNLYSVDDVLLGANASKENYRLYHYTIDDEYEKVKIKDKIKEKENVCE